ncbi:single-stranded DNA-binding protein [Streptomyces kronopolitis]|uniref:single-stranded DNA-binding protein n=1 Tax=Streptomyces kronopolitis TaxID=1612435 RepID=UPI0036A76BFD
MAGETPMTVHGIVSGDPALRFTPKTTPAARVLVVTPREEIDRKSGRWVPGTPQYTLCTALGQLANDMAEILEDGTPVIVSGHLDYIEGEFVFLRVQDIAVSLRNGLALTKTWKAEPTPEPPRRAPEETAPAPHGAGPAPEQPATPSSSLPAAPDWWKPGYPAGPDWWVPVCRNAKRRAQASRRTTAPAQAP